MALDTRLSIASWNLALNAALDVLNAGYVELYSGTKPANPDAGIGAAVLLATCGLAATAFGPASGATKIANAISNGVGTTHALEAITGVTSCVSVVEGVTDEGLMAKGTTIAVEIAQGKTTSAMLARGRTGKG